MCDELDQISAHTQESLSPKEIETQLCLSFCLIRVQCNVPQTQQNCAVFGQHKGNKPSHWTPIASSHVVQTRISIVVYIKYQHPGSLDLSSLSSHLHMAGWHCSHWRAPKSAFTDLKAASLSTCEMRTLSLIAGVSDASSFCTPSPLLWSLHSEVRKDLQKHRSTWGGVAL